MTRYFRECKASHHGSETLHHQLGLYLSDVDRNRLPEAWAAEISRTLQLFPIFEIGVSTLKGDLKCLVLRKPDAFDSDAVLGVPEISSTKHKDFVSRL